MVDLAFVNIWNHRAGAVYWDNTSNLATFEFEESFLSHGIDLSPVIMPMAELVNGKRTFSFRSLSKETYKGLPGLLADSPPDRYGDNLINQWLAVQGKSDEDFSPVDRLCYIGKRGMGALEFEPAMRGTENKSVLIEINELADIAGKILNKKEQFQTQYDSDYKKAVKDIIRVGTSAGGARAKAVIAVNEKTKKIRSGQVDAPEGFEHWILKFDGVTDILLGETSGFGRIEYAYYKMALDAGIKMTECRLLEEDGRAHFMIKRFDRMHGNVKVHMQTLCAIAHFDYNDTNSYSYEQAFQVMRKMKLPYDDFVQMFTRMVFNVVTCNCDDHTKNVSFLLKQDGQWQLSPAYDVIYSYNPLGPWTNKHQMSVNGKREDISLKDLLTVSIENNIRHAKEIIDKVLEIASNWQNYATDAGVPGGKIKEIQKNLQLKI
jgi:serine/threonine-protein kinase HipA